MSDDLQLAEALDKVAASYTDCRIKRDVERAAARLRAIAATPQEAAPRAAEAVSEVVKPCVWSQEDWESDCWVTSCGNAFSLNDGTPSDNSIKHCCYCGRHVAEELWVDPNEDDDDAALTPPSAKGE